jgi:hypothetical protein
MGAQLTKYSTYIMFIMDKSDSKICNTNNICVQNNLNLMNNII